MAIVQVKDATGSLLDWMVAKCEGTPSVRMFENSKGFRVYKNESMKMQGINFAPSTVWAQGGPIKERENIATRRIKGKWYAILSDDLGDGEHAQWCKYTFRGVPKGASTSRRCRFEGETELQAAMRCCVASKFGEEVEVPDELI